MSAKEISLADLANKKKHDEDLRIQTDLDIEAGDLAVKKTDELTAEERREVDEIKDGINLLDSQQLVTYGVGAQKQLTSFTDSVLDKVRSKDAGQIGDTLTDLMVSVQSLEVDSVGEDRGFLARLGFGNNVKKFMAKYDTVSQQIDKLEAELDSARMMLLKDITIFDTLYERNLEYFNQLDILIIAGDEKVAEARNEALPKLAEEAAKSGDSMDAQLVRDFEETINRFEKKVHDLKLSKTISIQTAPQIRLIQNNDKTLVDKIQTAILNVLPLWKNQIVIALGLQNQEKVLKMNRQISDTTNQLLKQNAALLKTNTIETAKESERGIVEVDTLKQVNQDLIETINETMKIHRDGRAARQQAEVELAAVEDQLRVTLLQNLPIREAQESQGRDRARDVTPEDTASSNSDVESLLN